MLKFPSAALLLGVTLLGAGPVLAAGDAANGEIVFKKCAACHQVGPRAKNRVGPELNDLFGRTAGGLKGFRYSKAMVEAGAGGLAWDEASLDTYLESPRTTIKGNRMAFPGLRDAGDRADVIAYLARHSNQAAAAAEAKPTDAGVDPAATAATPTAAPAESSTPTHGVFQLGRSATAEEISAWDIDVRPDGVGLPEGRGTVADGEVLFTERCASCHGDFGEGIGRWPVLAGGQGTLTADRPEKTIGSYWPYLSTVYDYIRRAMPFGDSRSLGDDDVYAITAYLLYMNDVVTDDTFELSRDNFATVKLPNEANFIADDRTRESHYATKSEPCMSDCKPAAKITMRARVLDVTPEAGKDNEATTKVD